MLAQILVMLTVPEVGAGGGGDSWKNIQRHEISPVLGVG